MDEIVNYNEVGLRIKAEREKLGYSREKFSEMVDISPVYLGQVERAERKLSLPTFVRVASNLNLSLDYLIFGDKSYNVDKDDIVSIINNSSKRELQVISDILKAIMPNLKK